MTKPRLSVKVASAALALLVAVALGAPLEAQSRHQPKGNTSGSGSSGSGTQVEVRVATPSSSASRQSDRRAVRKPDTEGPVRRPQADSRRAPRGDVDGHVFRHRDFFPFYYGHYRWYPWGWWGWYPYGPYGPYGYYPWGSGVYWYGEQLRPTMGALDLDVRPEEAQVYLDGHLIGIADNFDGWPRHLWLEQGTYDLVLYLEGYETIARQYTIYPGLVIDVEDRMARGEAVLPEDRLAEAAERRQELLRERLEQDEEYGEVGEAPEPGGAPTDRDEPTDWRDRVRSEREEVTTEEGAFDARSEPARLRLSVVPPDAAVYLDGRFLGTGRELGDVHAGLIVDPGEHELEVARPGYASKTTTFDAEPGEEVELTVELEEAR